MSIRVVIDDCGYFSYRENMLCHGRAHGVDGKRMRVSGFFFHNTSFGQMVVIERVVTVK